MTQAKTQSQTKPATKTAKRAAPRAQRTTPTDRTTVAPRRTVVDQVIDDAATGLAADLAGPPDDGEDMEEEVALDDSDLVLDLDAQTRPNQPPPFKFRHAGRVYIFGDPQDFDWQHLLMVFGNPKLFVRMALPNARQYKAFMATKCPSWKMNILMDQYLQHYGLPSLASLQQQQGL